MVIKTKCLLRTCSDSETQTVAPTVDKDRSGLGPLELMKNYLLTQ